MILKITKVLKKLTPEQLARVYKFVMYVYVYK